MGLSLEPVGSGVGDLLGVGRNPPQVRTGVRMEVIELVAGGLGHRVRTTYT